MKQLFDKGQDMNLIKCILRKKTHVKAGFVQYWIVSNETSTDVRMYT